MSPSIPLLTDLIALDTIVVATTAIPTLLTTAVVPLAIINRTVASVLLVRILAPLPLHLRRRL